MNTNLRNDFEQSPSESFLELEFLECFPFARDGRSVSVVSIQDFQQAVVIL